MPKVNFRLKGFIMIQQFLVALFILTAIGCAQKPMQPRTVDGAFETYVQEFEKTWGHTANMTIEFADLSGDLAGVCDIDMDGPYAYGTRTIQIDSTYWSIIDNLGREQLLYHELGHCALGRVHWSALDGNPAGCTWDLNDNCDTGYPLTIMYPVAFGDNGNYGANEAYYIGELFANSPTHKDAGQGTIPAMGDYFVRNARTGQ